MIGHDAVRYLVGADGQPMAVQVEWDLWRQIVAALEDAADTALAHTVMKELDAAGGPAAAGWPKLEDLEEAWLANESA